MIAGAFADARRKQATGDRQPATGNVGAFPRSASPVARRLSPVAGFSLCLFLTISFVGGRALAQEASTGIPADRLRPGLGPATMAAVEGAETSPSGVVSTVLGIGYVREPIVLRTVDGARVATPVRAQLNGSLGVEIGLPRGFALRLGLPVTIVNDGDRLRGTGVGGSGNDPGPGLEPAVGDLAFGIKVALLGAPSQPGLHAAIALEGSVPLGGEAQFAATDGPTIAPRLFVDYRLPWLTLAIDAQARFARARALFGTRLADEVLIAAGAIAKIAALGPARRWHLLGYVEAQGVIASDAAARPAELRAALRLAGPVDVDVGGGAGLVDAVGAPRFRLFVLLRAPLQRARERR